MKRLLFISCLFHFCAISNGQAPQKISYQAVVRNASNALVVSTSIGMRVSILQGTATGTEVYKETYSPNPVTNANGLVSVEIGGGTAVVGSFSAINWASGPYFVKVETDPTGGTNYTISGTTQLLSVPYALQANSTTEDNINFPFPKQSLNPVYRKLYNNSYTVPANKLFYLGSLHASSTGTSSNANEIKIDTNTISFSDVVPISAFISGGTVISSLDTAVYMYGYLIDLPTVSAVFRDIKTQSYTVPTGKTFYMTSYLAYFYSAVPTLYLNNTYFAYWGNESNVPLILPSGTVIQGPAKISGYLR